MKTLRDALKTALDWGEDARMGLLVERSERHGGGQYAATGRIDTMGTETFAIYSPDYVHQERLDGRIVLRYEQVVTWHLVLDVNGKDREPKRVPNLAGTVEDDGRG